MKPHRKPLSNHLQTAFRASRPALFILHFTFSILHSTFASVPLSWQVTPRNPAPVTFDRHHGETLAFRCVFSGFGELPFGQAADIRLWYQTNGMGAAWWSVPASVSSNVLSATFPPQADPGADRLALFFGAPSNAYASAVLRLRPSPGFTPNVLPPPDMLAWAELLDTAMHNMLRAMITTNDVCSIVTNEVCTGFTAWNIRRVSDRPYPIEIQAEPEYRQGSWVAYIDQERVEDQNAPPDATTLNLVGYYPEDAYVATRQRITSNALGLARMSDLPPLTNELPAMAAAAVYDVHDLRWDEEEQILYWCKFVGGHDLCIAVTNINLTHPTNAVLLKKWRETNR